ncbi:hypothetical protein LINPERPRIM_LOCUS2464 [Linum perenne]
MNQAIKYFRSHHQLSTSLRRVNTLSSDPGSKHNIDKAELPKDNIGAAISNMPGEGYATRSDEAGFGTGDGGGNAEENVKFDKKFNQDHPAYDSSQGSKAKENDKCGGDHQTNADR